jgi:hypothetical protein
VDEREAKLQMEKWKDQYQAVFATEINDIWFVWRELSRAEYKKAMEYYEDDYDRAEYVSRMCVLDPEGFDFSDEEYAGIPEVLVQNILQESGFAEGTNKLKQLMNKYEQEMQSFENQISCVIVECFPHLNIETVENWSMEKTLWYFSRAKWMLETLRGVTLTQEKQE